MSEQELNTLSEQSDSSEVSESYKKVTVEERFSNINFKKNLCFNNLIYIV